MTLCDVMSCSMADVYRCFVRWPCVMWCHAVWQMCSDVLWDDPVCCDIIQYGRCVQMFCEMTLCDVISYSMADVYRCFVRWPCVIWCHAVWQMFCGNMLECESGSLFKIQVFQTVSHYICGNTSVRTSQLSGSICSNTSVRTSQLSGSISPTDTERH